MAGWQRDWSGNDLCTLVYCCLPLYLLSSLVSLVLQRCWGHTLQGIKKVAGVSSESKMWNTTNWKPFWLCICSLLALQCSALYVANFAWCIFWRALALSAGATQVTRRRDPKTEDYFWDQTLRTQLLKVVNNLRNKDEDAKQDETVEAFKTWYIWQIDKALRLSISNSIWILSSDTICQRNQLLSNSEAAMLTWWLMVRASSGRWWWNASASWDQTMQISVRAVEGEGGHKNCKTIQRLQRLQKIVKVGSCKYTSCTLHIA